MITKGSTRDGILVTLEELANCARANESCVHYCEIGGHLWFHKITISCPNKTYRSGETVVKFFTPCTDCAVRSRGL